MRHLPVALVLQAIRIVTKRNGNKQVIKDARGGGSASASWQQMCCQPAVVKEWQMAAHRLADNPSAAICDNWQLCRLAVQ